MGSRSRCGRARRSPARLLTGTVVATAAAVLMGCASESAGIDATADERCISSCSRLAPDGESCFEWAALTSSACVARFSAADQCCGPGDKVLCAMSVPVPVGAACVCRGTDRHGPFVVQGSACRPG
jgi:hypothetical protein